MRTGVSREDTPLAPAASHRIHVPIHGPIHVPIHVPESPVPSVSRNPLRPAKRSPVRPVAPANARPGSKPRQASRRTIPANFRMNRRLHRDKQTCSKVALFGTGCAKNARSLMRFLQVVFECSYYGGFSRDGVWEAILTFNKNKCELPFEEEIEKCIEWLGSNARVDVLDATISRNVIACYHRISQLNDKFGVYPSRLQARIREYASELGRQEQHDTAESITGMRVTAQNIVAMHELVQDLMRDIQYLRGYNASFQQQIEMLQEEINRRHTASGEGMLATRPPPPPPEPPVLSSAILFDV